MDTIGMLIGVISLSVTCFALGYTVGRDVYRKNK